MCCGAGVSRSLCSPRAACLFPSVSASLGTLDENAQGSRSSCFGFKCPCVTLSQNSRGDFCPSFSLRP